MWRLTSYNQLKFYLVKLVCHNSWEKRKIIKKRSSSQPLKNMQI